MLKYISTALLAVWLAAVVESGAAKAADVLAPQTVDVTTESGWTFTMAPYLWAAGIDGDVAAFGLPKVSVDASFSDILGNLDMALMGAAEARNGRFSIATDLMYVKLSADSKTPLGVLADNVDVTVKSLIWTGAGAYSLIYEEGVNLDVMAGARVWSVDNELKLSGGLLGGTSADDGETWVDPIVGLKGRVHLSPNLYLTSWAIIGGFGASSDLMWDVMGGLGYSFNQNFSLVAGYRGLGVDFSKDSFVYDVVQHGPILGAAFRF